MAKTNDGAVKTETCALSKTRVNADLPRVLLVEDEKPIRDFVIPLLFAGGFDCREAADGRSAIDLLATGIRINLVLSNMLLPVVNSRSPDCGSAGVIQAGNG
jgi:PleD family two-component response regulator